MAILITLKQFPVLFGIAEPSAGPFEAVWLILTQPTHWNAFSLSIGIVALTLLIFMRLAPLLPGSLIVIIAAIFASVMLDLQQRGVAVVGAIDLSGIWAGVGAVSLDDLSRVVRFAPPLVLILFADSWGTVRGLSLRHGETVDANKELRTFGLANVTSAVLQGMPVGAGFSAGAADEAANPQIRLAKRSRLSGLLSSASPQQAGSLIFPSLHLRPSLSLRFCTRWIPDPLSAMEAKARYYPRARRGGWCAVSGRSQRGPSRNRAFLRSLSAPPVHSKDHAARSTWRQPRLRRRQAAS